jgi:hypothetical protein
VDVHTWKVEIDGVRIDAVTNFTGEDAKCPLILVSMRNSEFGRGDELKS